MSLSLFLLWTESLGLSTFSFYLSLWRHFASYSSLCSNSRPLSGHTACSWGSFASFVFPCCCLWSYCMSSRSASQFVSLCCFVSVRCHFYLLLHFILSPCCRIVSVCGRFASLSEFNGGNLRHRAPSVQGHLILYLEGLFSNPSTKLAGQQAPDQSSGLVPGPEYNTAVFVCAAADCSSGQLHFYIFDHVWILKIHQQLMNSCSNQHES